MNQDIKDLLEKIKASAKLRIEAARMSHKMFFSIYLAKYANAYATAPFQSEIFRLTEDKEAKMVVIVAFRDSAKSTICTTSFPLWSILTGQAKFVIIAGNTRPLARQHLANIKEEVENNELLKNDLGPFKSHRDEWGAYALVFPKYGAKIMAVSSEQSVRGLRFKNYRPDLIIADDLEDAESVRTQEGRDKTYRWFKGELLPAGTRDTRVFVVGNLLHQDSLIVRLQNDIESQIMPGEFRAYPVLDSEGNPTWPAKYPTIESVEKHRMSINDHIIWEREFMLRIVPPEDQIVRREWTKTYDANEIPKGNPSKICIGVDLAIKEGQSNDFTAIVVGKLFNIDDRNTLYIDRIINRRMNFPTTIQELVRLNKEYKDQGNIVEIYVEDAGLQIAWVQQLAEYGVTAKPVKVGGVKKETRVHTASHWIKEGRILFLKIETVPLIEQLVGFGIEKHDDLADAFTLMAIEVLSIPIQSVPEIFILSYGKDD